MQWVNTAINECGDDSIGSIAFSLMQRNAEFIAGDDQGKELECMQSMHGHINDAFDEEIRVLQGGSGNVYRKVDSAE